MPQNGRRQAEAKMVVCTDVFSNGSKYRELEIRERGLCPTAIIMQRQPQQLLGLKLAYHQSDRGCRDHGFSGDATVPSRLLRP